MPNWLPAVSLDTIWEVLKWLGSGTVIAVLLWIAQLPQKAWRRFERWIIFKHNDIPRRPLLIAVRSAHWSFGAISKEPATQFRMRIVVTNVSGKTGAQIIGIQFRRAWRWKKAKVVMAMVNPEDVRDAVLKPKGFANLSVDGFILPRLEWENKAVDGTFWFVDQFHSRYRQRLRLDPGGDVPTGVEREKEKKAEGAYDPQDA